MAGQKMICSTPPHLHVQNGRYTFTTSNSVIAHALFLNDTMIFLPDAVPRKDNKYIATAESFKFNFKFKFWHNRRLII